MRAACATAVLVAGGLLAASASAASPTTVSVLGSVSAPMTYSLAQLSAMPQTSETIAGNPYQGVLLETLVNNSSPSYPSPTPKNALLRVVATVGPGTSGPSAGPVTFALGELDTNFGNNQALVALTENGSPLTGGPELVLPRDTGTARFVEPVAQINVAVQNPQNSTPPPGGINVEHGSQTTTLTAAQLAALPQTSLQVSYTGQSGSTSTYNETGPTLNAVLGAAGITPDQNTYVAAVGSGDYVATVTPAEATIGNRPLLISLNETSPSTGMATTNTPRLIADGDSKGGRYDSNVTDLVVGEGSPPAATVTTCTVTAVRRPGLSGHDEQDVTVSDPGGIASVSNVQITNGQVFTGGSSGPRIDPGGTAFTGTPPTSVVLTAVKTTQGTGTAWSFDATNAAGTTTHCA